MADTYTLKSPEGVVFQCVPRDQADRLVLVGYTEVDPGGGSKPKSAPKGPEPVEEPTEDPVEEKAPPAPARSRRGK